VANSRSEGGRGSYNQHNKTLRTHTTVVFLTADSYYCRLALALERSHAGTRVQKKISISTIAIHLPTGVRVSEYILLSRVVKSELIPSTDYTTVLEVATNLE